MSFLEGNKLNVAIDEIIDGARDVILLISPFIKLHERFKSRLIEKKRNPKISIIVLFGKNEEDITKSFSKEDFLFLKDFPNIEIRHEKRLHAKFYSNEITSIVSSMNLYEFSQNNNIEAGYKIKEPSAIEYFENVIDQSTLLYMTTPHYQKTNFGLTSRYVNSSVEVDLLTDIFNNKLIIPSKPVNQTGYCIRTGVKIPFNIKKPMCSTAYRKWCEFGNEEYPEKYCHFSGEPSNGETCLKTPVLKKNYFKAKKQYGF